MADRDPESGSPEGRGGTVTLQVVDRCPAPPGTVHDCAGPGPAQRVGAGLRVWPALIHIHDTYWPDARFVSLSTHDAGWSC
jgi:hypothetical protein